MSALVNSKQKLLIIGDWDFPIKQFSFFNSFSEMARFLSKDFDVFLFWLSADSALETDYHSESLVDLDFIKLHFFFKPSFNKYFSRLNRYNSAFNAGMQVVDTVWGQPDILLTYGINLSLFSKNKLFLKNCHFFSFLNPNVANTLTQNLHFINQLYCYESLFSNSASSDLIANKPYSSDRFLRFPVDSNVFYRDVNCGIYYLIILTEFSKRSLFYIKTLISQNKDIRFIIYSDNDFSSQLRNHFSNEILIFDSTKFIDLVKNSSKIVYFGNFYVSIPFLLHLSFSHSPILFLTNSNFGDLKQFEKFIIVDFEWSNSYESFNRLRHFEITPIDDLEDLISVDYSPDTIAFRLKNILINFKPFAKC